MKYRVDDEVFDNVDDAIDYCISEDYHRDDDYDFEDWVNDRECGAEINGYSYNAFEIISAIDDGNWSELKNAFCESMNDSDRENTRYELIHSEIGDSVDCQDCTIYVIADDDCGDYDGNDIEEVRQFVNDRKMIEEEENKKNKQNEDELVRLFQTIGG